MNNSPHPRRPPRLERTFDRLNSFYFVTFNTRQRRQLLARTEMHETLRAFCLHAQEYDVAVGRYVIMPDHIHLFVFLPATGITLSKWVQSLRSVLGKTLLALRIEKPHWQEGFFDHLLRGDESYGQKWNYVRMNPVRAGLSATPEAWRYQGEIIRLSFD